MLNLLNVLEQATVAIAREWFDYLIVFGTVVFGVCDISALLHYMWLLISGVYICRIKFPSVQSVEFARGTVASVREWFE